MTKRLLRHPKNVFQRRTAPRNCHHQQQVDPKCSGDSAFLKLGIQEWIEPMTYFWNDKHSWIILDNRLNVDYLLKTTLVY